jgi:hypothetical protein
VLAVVIVLTALAVVYLTSTRSRTQLSHRFVSAEAAHHLALSGVSAAVARFASPGATADRELGRLLSSPPSQIEQASYRLSSTVLGSPLAALVARYDPVDEPRVDVAVTFHAWKGLYPAGFKSPAGTFADPAEKCGLVRIVSRAVCAGVEREIECHKAAKVIRPAAPVVPRFTLFVKNPTPGSGGPNLMECEKRTIFPTQTGRVRPSASHDALVLRNSEDGYTAGGVGTYGMDTAGWVFLGSELFPEARWIMNLSYGGAAGEPLSEGFHLPRQAVRVEADESVAAALGPEGQELMRSTFGRVLIKTGLYADVKQDGRVFRRYPFEQEPVKCSSLHLFGSPERRSPTLVLGRAYRRLLVYSYLSNPAPQPLALMFFLPYIAPTETAPLDAFPELDAPDRWASVPPGYRSSFNRETVILRLLSNSLDAYDLVMSSVLEEPYMRGIDHIEKNLQSPDAADAFDPPPTLLDVSRVTRHLEPLAPDPGLRRSFLYDPEATSRIRLLDGARRPLFEGDLGAFGNADLLLPERSTYVFTTAQLAQWTADGKLRVRGIMVLDPKEPTLVLDRPLEVEEGGVLVARDGIEINASITSAAAAVPLTLVALEGRIRVNAAKVQAHLIALGPEGSVERNGEGDLEIKGGIAATHLDLESLVRGASPTRVAKTLAWDSRLDPIAARPAPLRMYFDTRRVLALRP